MNLAPGTRLGSYEVQASIGAGGMGEVYRGRDTRLDRTVAIKVLPSHWAGTPEMKQRFEREAQAIAALNHPHICTLHDIGHEPATAESPGIDFLVMEHLDGETLAARLASGPLDVDDALSVAIQVADALDKAHRHGIVHRDLKPGNIFLVRGATPAEPPIAKLLDFGLARLNTEPPRAQTTPTPTARQLTTPGAILGTLQYMSPEQLEGADADARSDIFAFGTVVHEMITGRKTFEGKSRVLLMSAIATAEPTPLSDISRRVPPALEHVIAMCLAKDPADRWQSSRDLLAALELVADGGADPGHASAAPVKPSRRLLWAALAAGFVIVAAASVTAAAYIRGAQDPGAIRIRVPITLTAEPLQVPSVDHSGADLALSPDGRTIAYVARASLGDSWSLYVRPIDSISPTRVTAVNQNAMPFFSGDGRWLGFVVDGRLKKVEASGGPAQDLAPAPDFAGGTWNAEGTIIFGSSKGLFRVSAEGGPPVALTTTNPVDGGHFWPHFLPDGRRYVYLAWSAKPEERAIVAGELDSKKSTRVMLSESRAAFVEPGYLVFMRESAAYARRFDRQSMAVSGEPIRIADNVFANAPNGQGPFASSPNGVIAYLHGVRDLTALGGLAALTTTTAASQLVWMGRNGGLTEIVGPPGFYRGVEVSPDGRRVAVHRHEGAGGAVVILDPQKDLTILTFDASRDSSNPIWSPGGERIAYSARAGGKWGLYQVLANGGGMEEILYQSDYPLAPYSWSPDGTRIVFGVQDPKTGSDLWVYPFTGDRKATPIVNSPEHESHGQISHDGKWLAYVTTLQSRKEIFVRPFPVGTAYWQVSRAGGDRPRWGLNDREIIFHELTVTGGLFSTLLSAPVTTTGAVFDSEDPQPFLSVVTLAPPHASGDYQTYAIHPKGAGFLVTTVAANQQNTTISSPDPVGTLIVAKDWVKGIK